MEPKVKGFVGAEVIAIKNASHDIIGGPCIKAGGRLENNGFYAQVEGGFGTAAYAAFEAGKNTAFGNSPFGLNTSVGGQYTVSTSKRDYYKTKFEGEGNSPTWNANDTRGYGNVALTYKNKSVELEAGVRAGVKTSTQPSLDGIVLEDIGQTRGTEYAGRRTKVTVSPIFKSKANISKNFSLFLDCSLDNAMFGAALVF